MSLVETPAAPAHQTPAAETSSPRPGVTPGGETRRRVLAIALGALITGVIAAVVFLAFEGPVAQSWYSIRHHQLASRLDALGVHHGAGAPIALLQIPRLGTNLVVAEGDTPQQLRSGPGHRTGSPLPGDVGNSVIVGHRSGWGGPFRDLESLKQGDLIVVQTAIAGGLPRNAVFTVSNIRKVGAHDATPFLRSTDRRLTLLTGTGGAYSDGRLEITAISGPQGKVLPATDGLRATTPSGSALWNSAMVLALVGIGGALLLGVALRRRYRLTTIGVVVLPIALVGLLGLLLSLDGSLPPLR